MMYECTRLKHVHITFMWYIHHDGHLLAILGKIVGLNKKIYVQVYPLIPPLHLRDIHFLGGK